MIKKASNKADAGPSAEPAAAGKVKGLRRSRPCPICAKPSTKEDYPFCSQRCKDVDLSRWLTGSYAIPAAEEDDPDDNDFGPEQ
ncbi:DNA gyrase inhibitor YacG [uncultured Cohaesibacter sp.]|uniref:DNA gyrase inhibitor YacG n=1 Tax=uncultured Cohaesibacter sp. TaxID=1002546 RepID=UPI0029C6D69C|nr:DNA gyrase inhibitor YacG [uncultured Cohaesibacter sp.]